MCRHHGIAGTTSRYRPSITVRPSTPARRAGHRRDDISLQVKHRFHKLAATEWAGRKAVEFSLAARRLQGRDCRPANIHELHNCPKPAVAVHRVVMIHHDDGGLRRAATSTDTGSGRAAAVSECREQTECKLV